MRTSDLTTLVLMAVCLPRAVAAGDFEVVAATGALEPQGLQAGQQLDDGTQLKLEPWGRALIRETTKCGLTHVVAGVGEYVLTLSEDCSAFEDPLEVAAKVQRGAVFTGRLKETGSGTADALVQALRDDPCIFLPRVSEEPDSRRQCPSGYALRGLRCSGAFCDDKDLLCCPYLGGEPDPSAKVKNSRWISEEFPNSMTSKLFLNGLSCRGPYCDDLLPQPFKSSHLANARPCDWTAWASEQPGAWLDCGPGNLVTGIRCQEDFCGDVAIYCCQAQVE